tara:strand:- start:1473 stop:2108 length:636 start_codon:yes stop_codon:yes gene_type:complete
MSFVLKAGEKKVITHKDIIRFSIKPSTANTCMEYAKECNLINCESQIVSAKNKRKNNIEYQFTGQLTTFVASEWFFRDGGKTYFETRDKQNQQKYKGDMGIDLPPYPIDVKGGRIRYRSKDILTYNLFVRPHERHKSNIYIATLADFTDEFEKCKVYLMGWIPERDLPSELNYNYDKDSSKKGTFALQNKMLNPLPKFNDTFENKLKAFSL